MRTIVLHASHQVCRNVQFFLRHGLSDDSDVDTICVVSDPNIIYEARDQVRFVNRNNEGQDFGAWGDFLTRIDPGARDRYDYFVFINQTVIGPFYPVWYQPTRHWSQHLTRMLDHEVKLAGMTINHAIAPHVQSTLFATDSVGLKVLLEAGIFDPARVPEDKNDLVVECEIRMSREIIKAGYNIRSLQRSEQGIDFRQAIPPNRLHGDVWYHEYAQEHIRSGAVPHPYETLFYKTNTPIDHRMIDDYIMWHDPL